MAEKAFLAAKKYKILNEEFSRERLSPCFLLDERGFCSGHSKYDEKNEEFAEIYRNGIKTEDDREMEERCGGFTCDFFDEHHVFFRKNEKTLVPALERLDSQLEKMDLLVLGHARHSNDKKKRKRTKKIAKKFTFKTKKRKN